MTTDKIIEASLIALPFIIMIGVIVIGGFIHLRRKYLTDLSKRKRFNTYIKDFKNNQQWK